ncbi:unnamed protein product [Porites lobata]|uniref:Fatty acid desaturase domain-containing protein n=1 Tax=Porites lobata TaxID=104759 RepID=A0ABN8NSY3_9CNID|nr:unnamed protein product [Porites lobata]
MGFLSYGHEVLHVECVDSQVQSYPYKQIRDTYLAHSAVHNALAGSSHFWNGLLSIFFIEIWGGFTVEGSYEAHIQFHHPYTNVIGLGDSSSWAAFLCRDTYLFIEPLFLQLLYPVVGLKLLAGRWRPKPGFCLLLWCYLLQHNCAHIHVNIFEHIGLPMCDVKKRPKRLY